MKPEFNESWLTAYVLGELDDEQKAAVEAELEKSEWARKQVEEIRATTELLTAELPTEPAPRLYDYQRRKIEASLQPKETGIPVWKLSIAGALAAAASLLVVFLLHPFSAEGPLPPNRTGSATQKRVPQTMASQAEQAIVEAQAKSTSPTTEIRRPAAVGKASPEAAIVFGTVSDPSGATIPGAHVTVRPPSGSAQTTVTDQAGQFQLSQLAPGEQRVDVSLPGFKTFSQSLDVREGSKAQVSATLQPGSVSEELNVMAAPAGFVPPPAKSSRVGAVRSALGPTLVGRGIRADRRETDLPPGARGDRLPDFNTEAYDRIEDNRFIRVLQDPLSTFSIDVDTASYSNVRRFLEQASFPPKDSVRIEEMINYFAYDYPQPKGEHPFAVHLEVAQAPWRREHRLVRVGIKGREIDLSKRPPSNLVFLIDVSGSMEPANKLPLLKQSMRLLVEKLTENDRVAMVVYAGASGLVLPSTSCDDKEKVLAALDQLEAGGSTNGGAGIQLAYQTAVANFIPGGTNRVILATDGDFNIGITNQGDLTRLIEKHAKSGVFLTVLGFGMGNYKDSMLEKLADRGNGNYAYIDTLNEGRKVLVEQMGGSLITIAKDVKIQVEFNPGEVNAYRLIGYENRILRHEDFNDDTKDAGEIGAGHTVTALYEVVPAGVEINVPGVDPLKYQKPIAPAKAANKGELLTIKLRYKKPDGEKSQLIELPVTDPGKTFEQASEDLRFAAAVASFGMLLRDSPYKGNSSFERILTIAEASLGDDPNGYRKEFVRLVKRARAIQELKSEKPEA